MWPKIAPMTCRTYKGDPLRLVGFFEFSHDFGFEQHLVEALLAVQQFFALLLEFVVVLFVVVQKHLIFDLRCFEGQ